jgi:hypothetical protein
MTPPQLPPKDDKALTYLDKITPHRFSFPLVATKKDYKESLAAIAAAIPRRLIW